jgi:cysteine desulfuration protein SufE
MTSGRKHAVNHRRADLFTAARSLEPSTLAMTNPVSLPTIEAIQADFEFLDDWEDRYRYVIELGRQLTPLAADVKTEANKVRGCASQVWLVRSNTDANSTLSFSGESDSHIVQGLIAILLSLANGRTPGELLAADFQERFARLGLKDHLTPQRSNGLASMIERIRADARAAV